MQKRVLSKTPSLICLCIPPSPWYNARIVRISVFEKRTPYTMSDTEPRIATEQGTSSAAPASSKTKGLGTAILWIVVAVIVLGVGYVFVRDREAPAASDTMRGAAAPDSMVASVNGFSITRAELDRKIQQIKSAAPAGATDPTQDAGFELNLLNEVINIKLLSTAAEAKGHTVADEEVQKELDTLIQTVGGKEAFDQQVQKVGLTEDELRANMRNELLIRKLLNAETDLLKVTASDSEIKSLYDQAVAPNPEAPAFADVSEVLRAQVVQQKSKQIIDAYIEKLRVDSKIDVTL